MGYKRAEWHSGLTYQQTCENCNTIVKYTDESLEFRPWYADGFIYCPKCKVPLRHREEYSISGPATPEVIELKPTPVSPAPEVYQAPAAVTQTVPASESAPPAFCTQCGKAFHEGDKFCSGCGTRRA